MKVLKGLEAPDRRNALWIMRLLVGPTAAKRTKRPPKISNQLAVCDPYVWT